MSIQKLLLPYNFTKNDEKCLDFIIQRYAKDQEVEITLFHAYVPVPDVDIPWDRSKTVMTRLSGNLAYLRQKIKENEEEIGKAKERLIDAGFPTDKIHTVFKSQHKDAAQEIIEFARTGAFDTVILTHNPSAITKFFTTSVSKKVSKALNDLEVIMVS
jgi:hypothetical protein